MKIHNIHKCIDFKCFISHCQESNCQNTELKCLKNFFDGSVAKWTSDLKVICSIYREYDVN